MCIEFVVHIACWCGCLPYARSLFPRVGPVVLTVFPLVCMMGGQISLLMCPAVGRAVNVESWCLLWSPVGSATSHFQQCLQYYTIIIIIIIIIDFYL